MYNTEEENPRPRTESSSSICFSEGSCDSSTDQTKRTASPIRPANSFTRKMEDNGWNPMNQFINKMEKEGRSLKSERKRREEIRQSLQKLRKQMKDQNGPTETWTEKGECSVGTQEKFSFGSFGSMLNKIEDEGRKLKDERHRRTSDSLRNSQYETKAKRSSEPLQNYQYEIKPKNQIRSEARTVPSRFSINALLRKMEDDGKEFERAYKRGAL